MIRRFVVGVLALFFCGGVTPLDANLILLQVQRAFSGLPPAPPALMNAGGPEAGERYLWRPVAIGGGGFVTGLSQDATGRLRVVRTDVHGAYRWDAGLDRWVQMVSASGMPPEDRVQASMNEGAFEVAVAPSDPTRVYMAMKGRVFRSEDGGRHWQAPEPGTQWLELEPNSEFRFNGTFMAVDPRDASHVLIGTPHQGLWRSADGGRRWRRVDSVPMARDFRPAPKRQAPGIGIWFAPPAASGDDGAIWAASAGQGVFVADRTAATFRPLDDRGGGPSTVTQAAFAQDGSFIAAEYEARKLWLFRAGQWAELTAKGALPKGGFRSIAVDRGHGRIIAFTDAGHGWCSRDDGATWRAMQRSISAGPKDPPWMRVADQNYFASAAIQFDGAVPGRLWLAQGQGVFVADVDADCSRLDWKSQARGIEEIVTTDIVAPPNGAPAFAGYDFGIHVKSDLTAYSTTYGPRERVIIAAPQVDWTPSTPGFFVTNASDTRTECCSEDGDAVMAGYSIDGGRNWTKFASLPQPPGTKAEDPWRMSFGSIAVAADSPDNIVWMPAYNRAPHYTLDRGRTWSRIAFPGERLPLTGSIQSIWGQRKTVAADRVRAGTFYLLHSGDGDNPQLQGLWRTGDGGRSWKRVFRGKIAPASRYSAKLRAVPGKAGHLFFTSGVMGRGDTALRRSTDGGARWTKVEGTAQVDDIAFGKPAGGRDYPAMYVSGQIGGKYGIWRSIDNAASWQRLIDFPLGRLDQVTVIEADKQVFGRVYVGYMGSGWVYGEPATCGAAATWAIAQCQAVE